MEDRLELVRIVASGGFGTVCVVRDRGNGHLYAAKVMRLEHVANPKVVARTRDEATLLTRLRHPNIVHVYGLYEIAGRPVLMMEWVLGVSLERLVKEAGALRFPDAASLIAGAADALGFAHDTLDPATGVPLGVVHRDIKPSNMLITLQGHLKLVDFGIAHGRFEGKEAQTVSMVLGTRDYLAPERLDGEVDRPAGDVFALGCVLYELLAGGPLSLSMSPRTHERQLERQLKRLHPRGLDDTAATLLRELLSGMCSYGWTDRPAHREVVDHLSGLVARSELRPDLDGLAERVVVPLFSAQVHADPRFEPAYEEVAFLEARASASEPAPEPIPPPSGPLDARIRRFLEDPRWLDRSDELRTLLAVEPTWSAAPFVELLDRGLRPWWRFWDAGMSAAEIATVLQLVEPRADARILAHATTLRRHADPRVAGVARRLLDRYRRASVPGA